MFRGDKMNKILLVEDEESIRAFLKINLQRNNLAVLDVMLPGIDGFKVCNKLRSEFPDMGIIMLTAKGQDMDKIMGLEYGADDYIVKPFNPLEVVLRIKALLRRLGDEDKDKLELGPFLIDLYSQKVLKDNIEIDVTPKEYLLMKIFLENPNKAFTRDELLDLVWGENYFGDAKIIDVNIRRLRAKIEDNASDPKYIETIWGIGYRWKSKE